MATGKRPNNNQIIKPTTKATINDRMRAKARANKHIVPIATGEVVVYKSMDGTRPFYLCVDTTMDSDGMRTVELQKIGADGILMTQRFWCDLNKVDRYWLQYKDEVRIDQASGTFFVGTIDSIYIDRDGDLTVTVTDANKHTLFCNEEDLKNLTFYQSNQV